MLPFCLSASAWVRYWMPPAQLGLRAHAGALATSDSSRIEITMRRDVTGDASSSGQAIAVDRDTEHRAQVLGRLTGRQHARHEDLEVLHHLRDAGVDGELQNDRLRGFVDVEKALLDRVVHAVVD